AGHVPDHPPPELRGLACDGDVAVDADTGAVAIGLQDGRRRRRRVSLTTRVAALGADDGAMVGVVGLGDARYALVLGRDRADLDLHDPAVLVAFHLLELRARHARRDALDVEQYEPRLLGRHVDAELVR